MLDQYANAMIGASDRAKIDIANNQGLMADPFIATSESQGFENDLYNLTKYDSSYIANNADILSNN